MDGDSRSLAPGEPVGTSVARPSTRRRAALRLVGATLVAAAVAGFVFWAVLEGAILTGPAERVLQFFYRHTALAMLAACSPLLAAMLVGYGYMQRAIRRRTNATRAGGEARAPGEI
jgi:hypothetical protein